MLLPIYPALQTLELADYKVRILTPNDGTKALTRVRIEHKDKTHGLWSTIGVSTNVIDASYEALRDSIILKLIKDDIKPAA